MFQLTLPAIPRTIVWATKEAILKIKTVCQSFAAFMLTFAPLTLGAQTWIPIVAHTPGLDSSVWQTDVSLLNTCDIDTTVELVFHLADGEFTATFEIGAGRQQIFDDVVNQLAEGDLIGPLEIRSDVGISATSRTFNLAADGTFGQGLDGVIAEDGFSSGELVTLQQLRQDALFRSNLGVLNMGSETAIVEVRLFDRLGSEVGDYRMQVAPGTTAQDNRPFSRRFSRDDIIAGWATVIVESGDGVWPYASVVDGRTGDPTTVSPQRMADCPMDIAERLASIEGMTVIEKSTRLSDYRYFWLFFSQPIDHNDPNSRVFLQYMTLLHREEAAPLVFETLGYGNSLGDRRTELARLLEANQLGVEHRFFGTSDPGVNEIEHLTIEQAAADHHRIAEVMKAVYQGTWISSGASKGGMTAIFHRRFYPDDVDATVPFVAPISFGAPDDRYVTFLDSVGTPACRDDLAAFQRQVLIRRQPMLDRIAAFAANYGLTFDRIGGAEVALESAAVEIPFTFWQYSGENYCSFIPPVSSSDDEIFNFFATVVPISWTSDGLFDFFDSYFHQAQHQLGYPDLSTNNIDDLIQTDWVSLEKGLVPLGVAEPVWDSAPMIDIADWVTSEGSELLFVYGENDTWTAGAFDLGGAVDSSIFVVPGGTHGASIGGLDGADQSQVYQILERWTGVTPTKVQPMIDGQALRGRLEGNESILVR